MCVYIFTIFFFKFEGELEPTLAQEWLCSLIIVSSIIFIMKWYRGNTNSLIVKTIFLKHSGDLYKHICTGGAM